MSAIAWERFCREHPNLEEFEDALKPELLHAQNTVLVVLHAHIGWE